MCNANSYESRLWDHYRFAHYQKQWRRMYSLSSASPTSNQDHGASCLVETMERVLKEHGVEHNSKMF